jgi:hypothetical protein
MFLDKMSTTVIKGSTNYKTNTTGIGYNGGQAINNNKLP